MTEAPPPNDVQEPESASDRRLGNIIIIVGLVALLGDCVVARGCALYGAQGGRLYRVRQAKLFADRCAHSGTVAEKIFSSVAERFPSCRVTR